ncbi:hypothetical protein HY251_13955 [bacterium]|nr:hypothetical protein [bacterium]
MPATRKSEKKPKPAKTGAKESRGLGPRDSRTDVKIAGDWLDRWLTELDEVELKVYLQIAHFYNVRTYHDASELETVFGTKKGAWRKLGAVLGRLEKLELLEVIRHEGKFHYHFPHRDTDGFHRGQRARPSIKEALAFQQKMTEELCLLTSQDETVALRERCFEKYPQLREEHRLFQKNADRDAPMWRLWMEVSRHLIAEFERRFGSLKEDHGEIFKGSAAQVLRHHLDVVDGVTREVCSQVPKIFKEATERWAVAPTEEEFVTHSLVRRLAQRYNVGPTEIFANTLEALAHWGITVVETDRSGKFQSLVLPSTTGLTKSEERVLFLRPDEREAGTDTPRNRERVRRARNKYANHLIKCGVETLLAFFKRDKVKDLDAALQTITEKVNDALSLLPAADGAASRAAPQVALEHVIDRFDGLRKS